jgi:hypothetical protein
MGQHVRAFEVDVYIDKAGCNEVAFQLVDQGRVAAGSGCVDTGDHRADDSYVRGTELAGDDVDELAAFEQKIKGGVALCGLDGTAARG